MKPHEEPWHVLLNTSEYGLGGIRNATGVGDWG